MVREALDASRCPKDLYGVHEVLTIDMSDSMHANLAAKDASRSAPLV